MERVFSRAQKKKKKGGGINAARDLLHKGETSRRVKSTFVGFVPGRRRPPGGG